MATPVPATIDEFVFDEALVMEETDALAVPNIVSVIAVLPTLNGVADKSASEAHGHVNTLRGDVLSLMPLMVL
jgi:hypothetical protein